MRADNVQKNNHCEKLLTHKIKVVNMFLQGFKIVFFCSLCPSILEAGLEVIKPGSSTGKKIVQR